jgi:hypothetical protein
MASVSESDTSSAELIEIIAAVMTRVPTSAEGLAGTLEVIRFSRTASTKPAFDSGKNLPGAGVCNLLHR